MRRFDGILLACVTAILVAGLAVISWQTVTAAERLLLPALDQKARTVARSISGLVGQAGEYGIGLDKLVRAEDVLQAAVEENGEFAFVRIVRPDGSVVAQADSHDFEPEALDDSEGMQTASAPIVVGGASVGDVVVGTPDSVARVLVRELWLDVAVLLIVSVLVALELVSFAFTRASAVLLRGLAQRLSSLWRGDFRPYLPLAGTGDIAEEVKAVDGEVARVHREHAELRAAAVEKGDAGAVAALDKIAASHKLTAKRYETPATLAAVRAPVFLFYFAEELTRAFLPSYIESMAEPIAGLSVEFVIALPIIIFMAIMALGQPVLNVWTETFGRSRSVRLGAMAAVLGFLGTAMAGSMGPLIAARAVTAVGFAIVFVAAQGYIVDRTGAANRARGMSLFVSAIMAAMLCGPPIGGIIADRLGPNPTFLISAAMALVAYICALVALPNDERGGVAKPTAKLADSIIVLKKPAIFLLMLACAFPAKMILIGIAFYYIPLDLAVRFDQSTIGRVLMLYGLVMLVVVPAISTFSDHNAKRVPYVVLGGVLSGLAVAHLFLWPQPWGAALFVVQVGIAQGLSTTPQTALVGELGRRYFPSLSEGGVYGVFRLIERSGNAAGPAVFAAVWAATSAEVAILFMGFVLIAGALLFGIAMMLAEREPVPVPSE
ncbi:MFS transporter [Acuticoccus sp. I52.16.1]|uniref:MFS transporter n=1 Tax=Acuticoccus sp. I52.16.1 TaxID=2928472 RepID=UPI001FD4CBE5|nr:MFS transporter [Acuticoccus sp. I52.16.1]UOM32907.1 MFS transporter [Acuticoccus sp. I52.16.1]